jgi:predicted DNA binding CopG/RHH family protein
MNKKTIYSRAPDDIGKAILAADRVDDFLPPPSELVVRDEIVKVTINLNRRTLDFFKSRAGESDVSYQAMIRRVLDLYTNHYVDK